MPAITDLSKAISKATEKANKAQASRTDSAIIDSQIKAAEQRVTSAGASVTRNEMVKRDIEDKLSPPPTKTVASDAKKGGSKTVVDEKEKDKLEAQVRAAQMQIDQAKAAVEAARSEADELKTKSLDVAGVDAQTQQEMANLSREVDELQKLSKDPQTDLSGEAFQNKLTTTMTNSEKLAGKAPDAPNSTLQKFWEEVAKGFTDVQKQITKANTPTPAVIDKSNNYAGFFEDSDQGFNSIINKLESTGADREVVTQIRNQKDLISSHKDKYLAGMSSDDDKVLQGMMTHVNSLVGKISKGETLSNDDLAKLITLTTDASETLQTGGENFADVAKIPFDTITINLEKVKSKTNGDATFGAFYDKLATIFGNGNNNYAMLEGISASEMKQLYEFSDSVTASKNQSGNLSTEQINKLVTDGSAVTEMLKKYGFSGNSNGGGRGSTGGGGNSTIGRGR